MKSLAAALLGLIASLPPFSMSLADEQGKEVTRLTDFIDGPRFTQGPRLAVNVCDDQGDAWIECIVHALQCPSRYSLDIYLVGAEPTDRRLMRIVSDMTGTEGWTATAKLVMAEGAVTVELPVIEMRIALNELSGTWDLTLSILDAQPFFDTLSAENASGLHALIDGTRFDFVHNADEASLAADFVKACKALEN